MVLGLGSAVTGIDRAGRGIGHAARGIASALRGATRATGQQVWRTAVRAPLDTGGFLGASAAACIATSPSLLPRTWWMWTANIGLSQIYGYTTGALTQRLLGRAGRAVGLQVDRGEVAFPSEHAARAERWDTSRSLAEIFAEP